MDFVDFKGSKTTTTQTRTIPNQTAEEAAIQKSATDYANSAMGTANGLLSSANNLAGNANNVYNNYANTANNINNGYTSLLSGNLPSSYATARQQALNSDLTGTVGNAINSLGSRGILNSSVTGSAFDQISQNAADTLAKNYASDQNTYSGLLGNASAANTSDLSNFMGTLTSLLSASDSAANNTSDLFNQMYGGRMGTGSTSTTQSDGGSGAWSAVGSIGSALICFAGGTKIATPDGDKSIENIKVGDQVYSLDDANKICVETVEFVNHPHESKVWLVTTDKGTVKPTESQRFLTSNGFEYIEDINSDIIAIDGNVSIIKMELQPPELVYDFTATGRNIFFANGLAAEGFD
jgi:hypothetical protein